MADAPEHVAAPPSVERRIVSVLFADLVGFTTLSETLDPEDVATVQDAYFAATRETILRYGGVVEKFIGDAAMAIFGTPRARDDDAERAVRAGMALMGALEQIEARIGLSPATLQLRVGVNTGEVVLATAGQDAGRVTGDTVNTAARLQTAAQPGSVLIGELTALAVAETIETEAVDPLELKGKAEPVRAHVARQLRIHPSREEALGELRAPMLGRETELARLHEAAQNVAVHRRAERVVVLAPPGVGKSRLLAEFASAAKATVLRARVRPQATAPYETVMQLFDGLETNRLEHALEDDGVSPARATVVAAEVRRLLHPQERAEESPGGDLAAVRDARFDAWVAAIDALAGGPATWLVEDVHWAGDDLLAFLEHAGEAESRHGRLVVATARPSLLETAPAWVGASGFELPPLEPADAGVLVRALVGSALPDDLVATVVERADGTPLFIEELLRTWASVGTLVREGDAWHLAVHPEAVPMPPTVQAIYAAQLDDLPADARQVARRGAVAGRRVPVDALGPLEIDGRAGLDSLQRRAFVAGPIDDPITGEGYTYRHALLRDAGYASLARVERARLHLAMARWLESVAGTRADVVAEGIAEHYATARDSLPALAGGDLPDSATLASDAAAWYERAAEAALRIGAPAAAVRLLDRSVALTAAEGRAVLAWRRLRLGETLAASDDLGRGIVELEAGLRLAEGDPDATERAAYALAVAYMQQIRFGEAEALAARTLERLAGQPPALGARLQAMHAWAISAQGRSDGVQDETEAALSATEASGDARREVDVLEHVAAARDEIGDAGEALWARLEEKAQAIERWHSVAVAGRIRATFLADRDPAAAERRMAEVAEAASARGLTEQAGWTRYGRAETLWVLGRWDEALAVGEEVIGLADRFAYRRLGFRTWLIVLAIAGARRDGDVAGRWDGWWAANEASFPGSPSPYARIVHSGLQVWVADAVGRPAPELPEDLVDCVIPMMNPHFLAAVETIVGRWLVTGRRGPATAAAERLAAHAREEDATALMRTSAALLDAWVTGSPMSAETARQLASAHGAAWWEARALEALGDPAAEDWKAALGIRAGSGPGQNVPGTRPV